MTDREEFKKWYNNKKTQFVDWEEIDEYYLWKAWQYQQKIIDALQHENEQLENKIKAIQDSAQKCLDTLGKYGI